jgi:hypothetical protein
MRIRFTPRALRNLEERVAARLSYRQKEQTGAGEGIRTLDPNLGKVVLYP